MDEAHASLVQMMLQWQRNPSSHTWGMMGSIEAKDGDSSFKRCWGSKHMDETYATCPNRTMGTSLWGFTPMDRVTSHSPQMDGASRRGAVPACSQDCQTLPNSVLPDSGVSQVKCPRNSLHRTLSQTTF